MRNRELGTALENFRRCADDAPAGTYQEVKSLAALLGNTCDEFMREVRAIGLRADNCDMIYEVEAALYDYVKRSNPDSTIFPTGEGFGDSMSGPARDRVLAQASGNLEFLRAAGAI